MKKERFIVKSIVMALALVGLLAFAGTASASVVSLEIINVNIDVTVRDGLVGPGGGLGETWNTSVKGGMNDLLDAGGATTTVDFTTTAGNGDPWGSPTLTMLTYGAFAWGAADPYNLVISSLAGVKYDLYIASFYPNEYGSHGTWTTANTVSNGSVQSFDNGVVNYSGGNSTTWVEGNNYVVFKDIVPDGDGKITVTGLGTENATFTNQRCMLNGFQIREVPEPATLSLMVLGGLAVLRRRRRVA